MPHATLRLLVIACIGIGCQRAAEPRPLRLATTTSVENTGLLAALLVPFERRTGVKVHVLAVGSGQALALGSRGDVDAVLVHAPEAEQAFMAAGHGSDHRALMHNDFVLVGPKDDPAEIRGDESAVAALRKITELEAKFVSRGDQSGTHMAEQKLWQAAGLEPAGAWYMESGQGQRMNLTVADEKQAYCLTDRATFITARSALSLEILVASDARLVNPYSVIAVHAEKHPDVNHVAALALVAWLTSREGQERIGAFQKDGVELFHPVSPATE
jgi:tungstate transport system substrate-binding protein